MPTVLENYYNLRCEVDKRIAQGNAPADAIWWHGELVYRIGVLETCQMFCKTAPICLESKVLQDHYIVFIYRKNSEISQERRAFCA